MSANIRLSGLTKAFDGVVAVDAIDVTVESGLLYALLGPSGCGKTTTLRMIAGLETPTAGAVYIGDADVTRVPPYERDLGLVFQNYALFPHMDVRTNVAFGLRMRRLPDDAIATRVAEVLALVQLTGFERRRPKQLSGGQQQRVALARALVTRPRALLLDEPLSNLDKNLRDEMRAQVRDIQRRLGITSILVTHDQEEALAIADRVVVMNKGRIEQIGRGGDVYRRPASLFVARFVGTANIFKGRLSGDGRLVAGAMRLPVPAVAREGDQAALIVRPADATLAPAGAGGDATFAGTVENHVYQGAQWRHIVRLADGSLFVVDAPDRGVPPPAPGSAVSVSYDPARCHVLTGATADE
jgi:putative spermidine/putrescine transport system ATP-binding protein